MSAPTQTLEELAEYEYIVEKTFLSEDNAIMGMSSSMLLQGIKGLV